MAIYFYRASLDGCLCVLENIFVNIPKIVIFLFYIKIQKDIFNNSRKKCFNSNLLAVTKAWKFLKYILDTHISKGNVT